MKLIFVYGPPATGKLTIAEKLSDLTGIPLFHNHLSRDLVEDIYGENLSSNYSLIHKIKNDVFSYCAEHNTDLIFTFVYAGAVDDEIVKKHMDSIEANGGKVAFVKLTAKREDLLKRVSNESRKKYKKLLNAKTLDDFLKSKGDLSIPFVSSLVVDTSELEPEEAVKHIVSGLKLEENSSSK
jgi:RNase adaptor protein for sRNA GlmZ degradation